MYEILCKLRKKHDRPYEADHEFFPFVFYICMLLMDAAIHYFVLRTRSSLATKPAVNTTAHTHTHTNTYTQHTHHTHASMHKKTHKDILRPLLCPSVRSLFVKIERYQQFTENNKVYFPCDADQGLSPVLDQGDHAALRHGAPPVLHPNALRRNWVRLKGLFTQKIKFASNFIGLEPNSNIPITIL